MTRCPLCGSGVIAAHACSTVPPLEMAKPPAFPPVASTAARRGWGALVERRTFSLVEVGI